jgi:branched-chain amino acid transport system substrate-binding protein
MKRKWLTILLAAALFASFTACSSTQTAQGNSTSSNNPQSDAGSTDAQGETVKIGVLLPLSGGTATNGEYQLEGMQLAVDYVNANGGIKSMNGAQVELVVSDTAGEVETGITEVERLITVENVAALCGPYNSGVAAATAPIAIQYGVPYVIVNAVADNIMQNGANKYVYRTNFGGSDMSPFRGMVVDYLGSLTDAGKLNKIALIYDAGDWGTSEYESYKAVAEERGIDVVVAEAITTNSSDLSSLVNKIKNSGADAVFCGIFLNDAVLFTKTMREYNCDIQIVGSGNGFSDSKWLEAMGDSAEGVMGTRAFNPSYGTKEGEATTLYQEYLASHNNTPMPEETSNGFCGMGTILEALEAAGSGDREAIADALYNIDLDDTSLPLWYTMYDSVKFNTAGDDLGRYNQNIGIGDTAGQILCQVIDGNWELVYPTERATANIQFP